MTLSLDQVVNQLKWRYATKIFDPLKKIPNATWEKLEDILVLTPSSYGLQPYKFLVVNAPEIRKQLQKASWNQGQVVDASHFVVFLHRTSMEESDVHKLIEQTAKVRNAPSASLQPYRDMMIGDLVKGPRKDISGVWASRQVYIALGQLMSAAAMLGIDTCPMEGLNPVEYDKILKLEGTGYKTVVACALGYRSDNDKYSQATKVRFDKKDLVQHL